MGLMDAIKGAASAVGIDITDDAEKPGSEAKKPAPAQPPKANAVPPVAVPSPAPMPVPGLGASPFAVGAPFTDEEMTAANSTVAQVTGLADKGALKELLSTEVALHEDIPNQTQRFRAAAKLITKSGKSLTDVIAQAGQVLQTATQVASMADQAHASDLQKIDAAAQGERARVQSEIETLQQRAVEIERGLGERRQSLAQIEQRVQEKRAAAARQNGAFKDALNATVQRFTSLLAALQSNPNK